MSRDPVMSRLRDANPDPLVDIRDEQLSNRIVSHAPPWSLNDRVVEPAFRRAWMPKISPTGKLRAGIAASGMVAAALVVALTVAWSGSAPNVAQAFPILNSPPALTPTALQQSLKSYGAAPRDGGVNIANGRAVGTPWGTGYILTSPDNTFVCVVAPGLSSADWGASCAQTKLATSSGTAREEYAYDPATHAARLLALLPQGATATMQTGDGTTRRLSLSDGLLAVDITSRTQITITINGHTTTDQFSPQDALPTPGSASGPTGGTMASTATAMSTSRAP